MCPVDRTNLLPDFSCFSLGPVFRSQFCVEVGACANSTTGRQNPSPSLLSLPSLLAHQASFYVIIQQILAACTSLCGSLENSNAHEKINTFRLFISLL